MWTANSPMRLLAFIRNHLGGDWTTKDLRWAIEHNHCWVNEGVESFPSYKLKKGDHISFWPEKRPHFTVEPGRILYEDSDLLAYNKPPYLDSPKLAQLLSLHLVHRLDRDTTGVILFAKTERAKKNLENHFRKREIKKEYLARVVGRPAEKEGVITGEMAVAHRREGAVQWRMVPKGKGLWSKTTWHLQEPYILCMPETGRTHQIRVHLKALGHPILGDYVYGSRKGVAGIFYPRLHASRLALPSGLTLTAPLPQGEIRSCMKQT